MGGGGGDTVGRWGGVCSVLVSWDGIGMVGVFLGRGGSGWGNGGIACVYVCM